MIFSKIFRHSFLSVSGAVSVPRSGVYILNGHFISRAFANDSKGFVRQLDKLRNYYEFLNIQEAVEMIRCKESEVDSIRGLAFTFDDGFRDCIEYIAPALCDFGVNACFFVNSGFVDSTEEYKRHFVDKVVLTPGKEPMTWEELRKLYMEGFIIGNHTKDHMRLSNLSEVTFKEQVLQSHNRIEEEVGTSCKFFAWPFGKLSDVSESQVEWLSSLYPNVFSGDDYKNYFSFDKKVLNRRHFEPDWPASHVRYFLSKGRNF